MGDQVSSIAMVDWSMTSPYLHSWETQASLISTPSPPSSADGLILLLMWQDCFQLTSVFTRAYWSKRVTFEHPYPPCLVDTFLFVPFSVNYLAQLWHISCDIILFNNLTSHNIYFSQSPVLVADVPENLKTVAQMEHEICFEILWWPTSVVFVLWAHMCLQSRAMIG